MARMQLFMLAPLLILSAATQLATSSQQTSAGVITKADVVNDEVEEREVELTPEDFEQARHTQDIDLSSLGIPTKPDPIMGSKFEGDIATPDMQQFIEDSNQRGRTAVRQSYRRWPGGVIPYTLSSKYGSFSKRIIARAMDEYHRKTCVQFVPRNPLKHRDYVYIFPEDGCYSLVGRVGGRQPLSLDAGCMMTGTAVHELMHTVGFFHEQSRNDRDDYIDIIWENVMDGAEDQFEKYSLRVLDNLGAKYDYSSIMHYGPYAFSANGRRTIVSRKGGASNMGQREGFSKTDLAKINELYYCDDSNRGRGVQGVVTERPSVVDPGSCEDQNWRCSFWSMRIFNYCEKYPEVRTTVCPESCGYCDGQRQLVVQTTMSTRKVPPSPLFFKTTADPVIRVSTACEDFNPACASWAAKGNCEKSQYRSFMSRSCPRACRTCPNVTPGPSNSPFGNAVCQDDPEYRVRCDVVQIFDRCRSYTTKDMIQKHCRKTCELC